MKIPLKTDKNLLFLSIFKTSQKTAFAKFGRQFRRKIFKLNLRKKTTKKENNLDNQDYQELSENCYKKRLEKNFEFCHKLSVVLVNFTELKLVTKYKLLYNDFYMKTTIIVDKKNDKKASKKTTTAQKNIKNDTEKTTNKAVKTVKTDEIGRAHV